MSLFGEGFRGSSGERHSGHAEAAATRAASAAERAEMEIKRLEGELVRLRLASRAMWELIKQRTELTDEDLRTTFASLFDDEAVDGPKAIECASCGRVIGRRQNQCMYCGTSRRPANQAF